MTSPRDAGNSSTDRDWPATPAEETWELELYLSGNSPRCVRALENVRTVCDKYLPGRYRIDVVDLLQDPRRAAYNQILAVPTLVRRLPPPVRKVVGDMSEAALLLDGLQLPPLKSGGP